MLALTMHCSLGHCVACAAVLALTMHPPDSNAGCDNALPATKGWTLSCIAA
jgi:hypothetical protein